MLKVITLVTLVLWLPASALATGQQADVLIYKGRTYDLLATPLESFYKNEKDKPPFRIRPNVTSTANWRGYVATWSIDRGILYLVTLDSWICRDWEHGTCYRASLRSLFGKRYRHQRVRADWFSGELRMPDGKMLQYVHMGFGSVYEREITLRVKSGRVVAESKVDNTHRVLDSQIELERQELEKIKPKPRR